MRKADERHQAARLLCDLVERACGRSHEAGPQQQILRRIAGNGELREEDKVGALVPRLAEAFQDQVAIPSEIADDRVDLSERESHRFRLTV